jgi:hypothetical protein
VEVVNPDRGLQLRNHPNLKELGLLILQAIAAILVHGYHPGVEDAEIYLPGIKKSLNPSLYPHNDTFFMSHAHMTLFPKLIAASVRFSHIPLDWALLIWQCFSIFLLLLACWHLGRLAFRNPVARWGGVLLVMSLLTLPVAGTALYIMDEYVTPRSLSAPAVLFIVVNVIERRFVRALAWAAFTAVIHPLMVVFGAGYAAIYLLVNCWMGTPAQSKVERAAVPIAALIPFGLFPPVTDAYRQALNSRPYFFLLRWHWYEWLGIFGPLALFAWWRSTARRLQEDVFERLSVTSIVFGFLFFVAALIITIPAGLANLVELQPMRSLHLIYLVLLVLGGGLLAQFVLKSRIWRWLALFLPLCVGMFIVQRQIFPGSAHLELPGMESSNEWVRVLQWIRQNTPVDAYFALDPETMSLPGEDQHGFRAIAERSMLADDVKDTGAVTMFPAMAEMWREQVQAQAGWRNFSASDFRELQRRFGVDWVVVRAPGVSGFHCPFVSATLAVCRVR